MTTKLIAAAAIALTLAAPAFAGDGNHGGNWNHANHWNGGHWHGGGGWRWYNGSWVWGLAGAAALGAVLATPYAYGAPAYPYYGGPYPAPVYPTPRQCPNGYGGWFWC